MPKKIRRKPFSTFAPRFLVHSIQLLFLRPKPEVSRVAQHPAANTQPTRLSSASVVTEELVRSVKFASGASFCSVSVRSRGWQGGP